MCTPDPTPAERQVGALQASAAEGVPARTLIPNAIPTDERIWVPVEENVWFRPLLLAASAGTG